MKKVLKALLFVGLCILCLPFTIANAAKLLDVKFISQAEPPGDWDYSVNCGQTCCVMVEAYYKGISPTSDRIKDVDDWLYSKYKYPVNDYNGSKTDVYILQSVLKDMMGFQNVSIYSAQTTQNIKDYLDAGKLVIVPVTKVYELSTTPHFILAKGYDDTYLYFNDPGRNSTKGPQAKYTYNDFNNGIWQAKKSLVVISGGSATSVTPTSTPPPVSTPIPASTAPSLYDPSNNTTIQINNRINFSWSNTGASRYQFQITNPAGSNDSKFTSNTYMDYTPNASGTWHWKVRKNTDIGVTGEWSEDRFFTVPANPSPIAQATPTPVLTANSGQFKIEYFNSDNSFNTVVWSEIANEINKNWGNSSPGNGVNNDLFGARFTGQVSFSGGWYKFHYEVDDKIKIWIDNQCKVDQWGSHVLNQDSDAIYISSGTHTVKVEYADAGGEAKIKVNWYTTSAPATPTPIPTAVPTVTPKPIPIPTAVPTVTPQPTPVPTSTPKPSVIPKPSVTPKPSLTPAPSMQAAPTLYSPSDYTTLPSDTDIRFSWSDIGAPIYKIVIYHYFDSSEQYYYASKPSYNYIPDKAGSYYWKVCAVSDVGTEGEFSKEQYFVVEDNKTEYFTDLMSTEIIFDNSNLVAGEEIMFSTGIKNTGLADTSEFETKWYVNDIEKQSVLHESMKKSSQDLDGYSQRFGNSLVFFWTPGDAGRYIISFAIDKDGHVAESNENNNMSYVEVNVANSQVNVTGIKLNKTKASLNVGKTLQLSATISPENATDKSILWRSSDIGIATVSANGVVKGIKNGTVYIYAFSADEATSAKCKMTISSGKNTATPTPTPVVERGNSTCNIANGGLVAQQGDWIYYRNYNVDWCIYKVKTDGTGKKKLNEYAGSNINVIGEWIYFSNLSDHGYLYKMKTDGSKAKRINTDNSEYVSVVDNWIYYKNTSDDGHIYKVKTDGTKRTKLNNNSSYNLNVVGDWIYYLNFSDGAFLYKIRTNGNDETIICNDSAYDLNVVGDWAYYKNTGDNNYLYKIKTDGTKKTRLNEDASAYVSVSGSWVYYLNDSDHKSLYKIKTDGTKREKLSSDTSETINVIGNWIYYENVSDERSFYRIKTDGTGREKVK